MDKTWKNNLKSESFWLRSLFMVLFFIVFRIADILVLLVAISQWFYVLLTGDSNASLSRFSGGLAAYVAQIVNYLSYNAEQKPFPFSDWPEPGDESTGKSSSANKSSAKKSTAKKTSAKKTSAKKSSAKKTTSTETDKTDKPQQTKADSDGKDTNS
ncbi:DUF4389 domain-containing protein [Bermanella sp. R86510]|uniref:DUF4389 domain-containing protein n=1 Tax=unclassified Bermanella TaxID=2627862 RepID=UPI0037C76175